jgi:hypothetical protein
MVFRYERTGQVTLRKKSLRNSLPSQQFNISIEMNTEFHTLADDFKAAGYRLGGIQSKESSYMNIRIMQPDTK